MPDALLVILENEFRFGVQDGSFKEFVEDCNIRALEDLDRLL